MFDGRFAPGRGIYSTMQPHSNEWYERIYREQNSYYYPWISELPHNHGEDNYLSMLKKELNRSDIVLDIGCGSGELTNEISYFCKKIVGYDRVKGFIDIANKNRTNNTEFIVWDSKINKYSSFPYAISEFTWVISSKGPLHWIKDLPYYLIDGCKLLMLVPYSKKEKWNRNIPPNLITDGYSRKYIEEKINSLLLKNNMIITKKWIYEVLEKISNKEEFYNYLTWGKFDMIINKEKILHCIDELFNSNNNVMTVNHCRLLWKSMKHRTTVST